MCALCMLITWNYLCVVFPLGTLLKLLQKRMQYSSTHGKTASQHGDTAELVLLLDIKLTPANIHHKLITSVSHGEERILDFLVVVNLSLITTMTFLSLSLHSTPTGAAQYHLQ